MASAKGTMARICSELARFYEEAKDDDKAIKCYAEALRADEVNEDAMVAAARVHLRRGHHDECMTQCETLLRVNATHEAALMMLADLLFLQQQYDDATEKYEGGAAARGARRLLP